MKPLIAKHRDIIWFCSCCKVDLKEIVKRIRLFEQRNSELENRVQNVERRWGDFGSGVVEDIKKKSGNIKDLTRQEREEEFKLVKELNKKRSKENKDVFKKTGSCSERRRRIERGRR